MSSAQLQFRVRTPRPGARGGRQRLASTSPSGPNPGAAYRPRCSDGLVAPQRDPLDDAVGIAVVHDGVVHRRPVVPEPEVAWFPRVPDQILLGRHVLEEELEQHVALAAGHADDPGRETRVHEKVLATSL